MSASSNRKRRAITALRFASDEMREAWEAQETARVKLEAAEHEWVEAVKRVRASIDMAKSIRANVASIQKLSAEKKRETGQ